MSVPVMHRSRLLRIACAVALVVATSSTAASGVQGAPSSEGFASTSVADLAADGAETFVAPDATASVTGEGADDPGDADGSAATAAPVQEPTSGEPANALPAPVSRADAVMPAALPEGFVAPYVSEGRCGVNNDLYVLDQSHGVTYFDAFLGTTNTLTPLTMKSWRNGVMKVGVINPDGTKQTFDLTESLKQCVIPFDRVAPLVEVVTGPRNDTMTPVSPLPDGVASVSLSPTWYVDGKRTYRQYQVKFGPADYDGVLYYGAYVLGPPSDSAVFKVTSSTSAGAAINVYDRLGDEAAPVAPTKKLVCGTDVRLVPGGTFGLVRDGNSGNDRIIMPESSYWDYTETEWENERKTVTATYRPNSLPAPPAQTVYTWEFVDNGHCQNLPRGSQACGPDNDLVMLGTTPYGYRAEPAVYDSSHWSDGEYVIEYVPDMPSPPPLGEEFGQRFVIVDEGTPCYATPPPAPELIDDPEGEYDKIRLRGPDHVVTPHFDWIIEYTCGDGSTRRYEWTSVGAVMTGGQPGEGKTNEMQAACAGVATVRAEPHEGYAFPEGTKEKWEFTISFDRPLYCEYRGSDPVKGTPYYQPQWGTPRYPEDREAEDRPLRASSGTGESRFPEETVAECANIADGPEYRWDADWFREVTSTSFVCHKGITVTSSGLPEEYRLAVRWQTTARETTTVEFMPVNTTLPVFPPNGETTVSVRPVRALPDGSFEYDRGNTRGTQVTPATEISPQIVCPVSPVDPVVPEQVPVCGPDNDTVTIPDVSRVRGLILEGESPWEGGTKTIDLSLWVGPYEWRRPPELLPATFHVLDDSSGRFELADDPKAGCVARGGEDDADLGGGSGGSGGGDDVGRGRSDLEDSGPGAGAVVHDSGRRGEDLFHVSRPALALTGPWGLPSAVAGAAGLAVLGVLGLLVSRWRGRGERGSRD